MSRLGEFHINLMGGIESRNLVPSARTLRLTESQITELREEFESMKDEKTLSRNVVYSLYDFSDDEADFIFEFFDKSETGSVQSYEFLAGMIILAEASLKFKANILFELYDFDHSQSITLDELLVLMETAMNALCYLTNVQPLARDTLEEHTRRVFAKIDINHDDMISLSEFISFITRDVEVVDLLTRLELITAEDRRPNWGTEDDPEMDSDLENETVSNKLQKSITLKSSSKGKVLEKQPTATAARRKSVVGGGDFMAVKPWEGVVRNSVPSDYVPKRGEDDEPDAELELEYVFGIRCHDTRNNIRYTATGEIVYHTAAVGIVLNQDNNTQKFMNEHIDDIVSFGLDKSGTLAVTGELGVTPAVCVWNTQTMEVQHVFKGILKKGVAAVDISSDGSRVIAMGADDEHSLVLYDTQNTTGKPGVMQNVIATGKCGKDTIFDLKFYFDGSDTVIACGVKVFQIITLKGNTLNVKKGIGWGKTKYTQHQALLCIGFFEESVLTGAFNGCLYVWTDGNLQSAKKIHEASINAIAQLSSGEGVITGGNDLYIHILDRYFNKTLTIDLRTVGSSYPKPRSICQGRNGNILVGTRGGEIFEFIDEHDYKIVNQGHYDKELWGLSAHPSRNEFCTTGQDCLLVVWNADTKLQKGETKLENPSVCCTYSPDGSSIAVGCENGKVLVYDADSLVLRVATHDRVKGVTVVKYSPNYKYLVAGGHDSLILVYDVENDYELMTTLKGHTSTVTHVDFSADGEVIQSVSRSYDLLYHIVAEGRLNSGGASAYKDDPWSDWSCILGWPVQGIWPPCSDGTDINMVRRSPSRNVLATVDDFGKVKLFKYPSVRKGALFKEYRGHSSHVTNCAFVGDYIVTTGGHDKSVFMWKYIETETIRQGRTSTVIAKAPTIREETKTETKTWINDILESAPSSFVMPKNHTQVPDNNLVLDKVLGYRSYDSKNNVRFTSSGKIVYPAASLAVVVDPDTKAQRFFNQHTEDVVSLAIHPNRQIVATGQSSSQPNKSPFIHVWNSETMEVIASLAGYHRNAVRILEFSPDGSKLLSVGDDEYHSLAVYDWERKTLLASCKVDKDAILGTNFMTDTEIVVYGARFIKFLTQNGKTFVKQRGESPKKGNLEAQLCGTVFNGQFVTGTLGGNLYIWSGRALTNTKKVLSGQISCLYVLNNTLVVAGDKGEVVILNESYSKVNSLNLSSSSTHPLIRSLDHFNDSYLLATRSSDILKVDASGSVQTIISGHFSGELYGLAMHPAKNWCATCGGDKTVRVWDLGAAKVVETSKPFSHDLRAIDWSPNVDYLAAAQANGEILLLNSSSLDVLSKLQTSFNARQNWISDLKFNSESSNLAYVAYDSSILEVASIAQHTLSILYRVDTKISGLTRHLDWSTDNKFLVITSEKDIKFVNTEKKLVVTNSSVKNVDWSSWTCPLGWPVQSLPYSESNPVHAVSRSRGREVLVSVNEAGKVELYRYPVVLANQPSKSYSGHGTHVSNVRFTYDDSLVVTTGGNDKCLLVWKTDIEEEDGQREGGEIDSSIAREFAKVNKKNADKRELVKGKLDEVIETDNTSELFKESEGKVDDSRWKGHIKPPSNYIKPPRNSKKAPAVTLDLEWVHGYRSKDCRNNLRYLPDGRIIYHAAALGIILDPNTRTQNYFNRHVDDITSFALNRDGTLAATGEVGKKPNIYVWDTSSLLPVANFKAPLERGITALGFSPSGGLLAAVSVDDEHNIAVFNLNTNAIIACVRGDTEKILDLAWINETQFVTTGLKHFKLWTLNGNQLKGRRGVFGKANNIVLSVAVVGDIIYTGTSTGTIVKWNGNNAEDSIEVHERAVDSLWASDNFIVTGGKDGIVFVLDKNLQKVNSFDLNQEKFSSVAPLIRSAQLDESGNHLLVGTYGSEIYEIDLSTGDFKTFTQGHFTPGRGTTVTNEVWGLLMLPNGTQYITSSDDGTLRVWDIESRTQISFYRFSSIEEISDSDKARCVTITPRGKYLAVGFKDGSFKIIELATWKCKLVKKDRKEEISDIKYSPDGKYLAVGSHDNFIDIYSVPDYKLKATCKGHSSYITHIDWSVDSKYLHSNCGAYELLFWEAETGNQIPGGASMLRDEPWNTWTAVIGFPVQGIYPPYTDGTDINAVDRSKRRFGNNEYELIATADDFSMVKLFRNPCVEKGAEAVIGRGHSSHVTNVRFTLDDDRLISTGGDDQCVLQWRVNKASN